MGGKYKDSFPNKPTQKEKCQSNYVLGKTAKPSVNNMLNTKKEGKKPKYNLFQQKWIYIVSYNILKDFSIFKFVLKTPASRLPKLSKKTQYPTEMPFPLNECFLNQPQIYF